MSTVLIVVGVVVLATGIPFFLPRHLFLPRGHPERKNPDSTDDPGLGFVLAVVGLVLGLIALVGGIVVLDELPPENIFSTDDERTVRRYATLAIVLGSIVALLSAGWLLTERLRPRHDPRPD